MSLLFVDEFNDTEGIDLASHVGPNGMTWTKHGSFTDALTIQSNRVGKDALTGTSVYYSSVIPSTPDAKAEIQIVDIGNVNRAMGVGLRISTAADHGIYARRQTATAWQLLTIVSSAVAQNLETIATAFSAGAVATLGLWCIEDKCWWSLDGTTSPLSPHTITSPELLVAGRFGIRASNNHSATGYHIENFTASTPGPSFQVQSFRPRMFAPGLAR